jgi:hypothetical protein
VAVMDGQGKMRRADARRIAQVLEDAERLIAAWNDRQAKRMPMLFSRLPLHPKSEQRKNRVHQYTSTDLAPLPLARRTPQHIPKYR